MRQHLERRHGSDEILSEKILGQLVLDFFWQVVLVAEDPKD
jgi:hypothetical protein